jgi:hypothetical protein
LRSVVAAGLVIFAGIANSAVLYSYQGQPFTSFDGDFSWLGHTPTAFTGFFILDQPIPSCYGGLDYCVYSFGNNIGMPSGLIDFGFSDGVTTYTLADLTALPTYRVNLDVIANAAGTIEYWGFDLLTSIQGNLLSHYKFADGNWSPIGEPQSVNVEGPPSHSGYTIYCGPTYGTYGCYDSNPIARSAGPGYWTTTVVPIPAAAWLFGSALGVMGVMRRKFSVSP